MSDIKVLCKLSYKLAAARMKARYRKTFAGFLWVVMSPIIVFVVQSLVFRHILKIEIQDYSLFLLGGLLPWVFISSILEMGVPILVNASELLKSFKLSPTVLVLSQAIDNFVNFIFAYLILLIYTVFTNTVNVEGLIYFPIAALVLFIGAAALTWLLTFLNVFYRDTRFLISFVMSVMFFLTPIFYPVEYIPEPFRWTVNINIFYLLIAPVRACTHDFELVQFFQMLSKSFGLSIFLILISRFYWLRKKGEFYATLV